MSEDQITIQTKIIHGTNSSGQRYVTLDTLLTIMAELYEKGIEIGWETKILDSLNERLRMLHNS